MNVMQLLPVLERPRIALHDRLCLPCGGTPRYLGGLLVKSGLREGYLRGTAFSKCIVGPITGACGSHCLTTTAVLDSSLSHSGAPER